MHEREIGKLLSGLADRVLQSPTALDIVLAATLVMLASIGLGGLIWAIWRLWNVPATIGKLPLASERCLKFVRIAGCDENWHACAREAGHAGLCATEYNERNWSQGEWKSLENLGDR